jgi:hypothetical protein
MYKKESHRPVVAYLATIPNTGTPPSRTDIAENALGYFGRRKGGSRYNFKKLMGDLVKLGFVKDVRGEVDNLFRYRITQTGLDWLASGC